GVPLVEGDRQPLEVAEDSAAQVVDHVLADPPGQFEEPQPQQSSGQGGDQDAADRGADRGPVAAVDRRDAGVDADGHQVRAGHLGAGDHDDQEGGPGQGAAVRAQQHREQPAGAGAQEQPAAGRDLVGPLGGDAAPVVQYGGVFVGGVLVGSVLGGVGGSGGGCVGVGVERGHAG